MKEFEMINENLNKEDDHIFAKVCEILDERLTEDAVGIRGFDLHSYLFNEELSFQNERSAEKACDSVGTWSAMRLVQKYEKDNYGECSTQMEPMRVANMIVYIYGEFILNKSEHLQKVWDDPLSLEDLEKIHEELQGWFENNLPDENNWRRRSLDGQVWDEYQTY